MTRIAVMGGGSWGTAFGMVLADAGGHVTIWAREPEVVTAINTQHVNERYHPGIALAESICATNDPGEALGDADIIVLAVPAQSLRENLDTWRPLIPTHAVLVSLMKGIEIGTSARMSQVIHEAGDISMSRIAVVSGPNLAREIALKQPAATTVACADESSARRLQDACTTDYFRPYWTTDVVGVEIGGSVKNVIALANGIAAGMGLGENSQASLITRGLAEMVRLGVALGADPLTFQGLAGVGDLIATCQSSLSRNRTFGESLGRGMSFDEATRAMTQTCEGVKSARSIYELARAHHVDMPITEQIVAVIHEGQPPRQMLANFMSRAPRSEPGVGA
ncbi:MAG: NAD(P)H-dependent glycerol-3-phosphate dehydrogenase [Candidatus Nanopelagicales bacterium]